MPRNSPRRCKGVHPAGLNFGDCFAYEVAKAHDCRLLFVGNDFSKTDVALCSASPVSFMLRVAGESLFAFRPEPLKELLYQNSAGLQRSLPVLSQYPSPMWQQPVAVLEQ